MGAGGCDGTDPGWAGWWQETGDAGWYAASQLRQLLLPLAITCAVAVAIAGTVPERAMAALAGPGEPYAIPAAALPLGLVDVKVAAVDHDWSGLRLVWRRSAR
ncbi:hypothetical protein BH20ACT6_BH20ACT6_11180 [soil metagenome]